MISAEDRDFMIRTVIGEAGNQPDEGKAAVASVIMNRVKSGRYGGNNVRDVVLAPKQFEPWQTRRSELMSYSPNDPAYQRAGALVDGVIKGDLPDFTDGATHFLNPDVVRQRRGGSLPSWAVNDKGQIGAHAFYAPEGGGGRAGGVQMASLQSGTKNDAAGADIMSQIKWDQPMKTAATAKPQDDVISQIQWEKPTPYGSLPTAEQVTQKQNLPELEAGMMAQRPSRGESFGRGLAQGATANFSDEIAGAKAAAGPLNVLGPLVGPLAGTSRMALEKLAPTIFGQKATEAYQSARDAERQRNAESQFQNPGTYLGGNLVGAVALPAGGAAGAGVKVGAATGAKLGAAYGGLAGFGEGDGIVDSAGQAVKGALIGGAAGGALGAAGGALSRGGGAPPPSAGTAVVDAAERLGVPVSKAVASDSKIVQRAGQAVRNTMFGNKVLEASENTIEGLGNAASKIATDLGDGSAIQAGQAAGEGIKNWISGKSSEIVRKAYNSVDDAIRNPEAITPLEGTRKVVSDIMTERMASKISDPGKAVSFVADAVKANGLTYEGVKGLRTRVGEMLDSGVLPADVSKTELKRVYSALSNDLRESVRNAGGDTALKAFERANSLNAGVAARREALAKIVGAKGDAPEEQIFSRIANYASSGSTANAALLSKARKVMDPESWNEVSSAVIQRLGRDANGNLTPDRFVSAWGKLSNEGKQLLFRPEHRSALEDIATVSSRMAESFKKFGNPSGTAQNASYAGFGAMVAVAPIRALATAVGSGALSRILASPASASSAAKWSRAYEMAVTKPAAKSISGLQIASRNFAATISDKLGISVTAEKILESLGGGAVAGRTDNQDPQVNGVIQ